MHRPEDSSPDDDKGALWATSARHRERRRDHQERVAIKRRPATGRLTALAPLPCVSGELAGPAGERLYLIGRSRPRVEQSEMVDHRRADDDVAAFDVDCDLYNSRLLWPVDVGRGGDLPKPGCRRSAGVSYRLDRVCVRVAVHPTNDVRKAAEQLANLRFEVASRRYLGVVVDQRLERMMTDEDEEPVGCDVTNLSPQAASVKSRLPIMSSSSSQRNCSSSIEPCQPPAGFTVSRTRNRTTPASKP